MNCPKCAAVIDVDEEELDEGDTLICDECAATLNVVGLDPLEVSSSDEEDDDDDDFDDDDDDDEDEDEEDEDSDWK